MQARGPDSNQRHAPLVYSASWKYETSGIKQTADREYCMSFRYCGMDRIERARGMSKCKARGTKLGFWRQCRILLGFTWAWAGLPLLVHLGFHSFMPKCRNTWILEHFIYSLLWLAQCFISFCLFTAQDKVKIKWNGSKFSHSSWGF